MPARIQIATAHGDLGVRAEANDEMFLFALHAAVRAEEFAAMPLDDAGRAMLLRTQFRAMRAGYQSEFPAARFEVVTLNDDPIGNIITDVTAERVLYVDIALLPQIRRLGLATVLMRALLEEPARLGLPGHVSVMEHNTASLALCRRLGFVPHATSPPFVMLEWRAPP
jgi:GNAT superfamily N-acetyltransferase